MSGRTRSQAMRPWTWLARESFTPCVCASCSTRETSVRSFDHRVSIIRSIARRPICASSRSRTDAVADRRRIGAREVVHPVHLPGLAVERERLLPVRMIGAVLDPQEADLDRPAAVFILAVELAAVALEAADHRREHLAGLAVDPVDRPLALLDVEGAKRDAAPALGREVELVDVGHAAEVDRAAVDRRELVPVVAADPARLEPAVLQRPGAGDEVEVVQAAGARGGVGLSLIHISEPTRLLSISYAVFCLKK